MNTQCLRATLAVTALLTATVGAKATTIRVPSDQPTIQAAINVAIDGDEVFVAPGIYQGAGNRDLVFSGKRIVVRSEDGAQVTTIDCEGTVEEPHRAFDFFHTAEPLGAAVEGFEIINGYASSGGGIRISGSAVAIQDCVFRDCGALVGAGASVNVSSSVQVVVEGCRVTQCGPTAFAAEMIDAVLDCEFSDNPGLAVSIRNFSRMERCVVSGNGSGIVSDTTTWECVIRECTVTGNGGKGIEVLDTPGLIVEGCTLVGNGFWGLEVHGSNGLQVANTVIWGNCFFDILLSSVVSVSCSAVDPESVTGSGELEFQNPPVTGDPLFCDLLGCELAPNLGGDYRLSPGSPCLAENSPCGEQIGALGPGCGDPSAAPDPVAGNSELNNGKLGIVAFGVQRGADLRFRVTGGPRGLCLVELVDPTGRRVASRVLERAEGGGEVHWDLQEDARALGSGVYFLRVSDGAGAEAVAKFVWLR